MKNLGKFITDANRKWWVLGTVCFALFMIILDGNVVNLALPSIIKTFNASISQVEWINNAYLLSFAILLITLGRLGDEFGRKKLFMFGLAIFTLGSMLCGLSGSVNQLIFFRILQGIGGAAMMPATLSLITVNFEAKQRGVALGIWGAISGLGIVFGPIIGGYLTESGLGGGLNAFFHIQEYWRYVFFINIPVGIVAFISAWLIIPESRDKEKKHPIDFVGIVLSALAVFFLTFALIEGTKYGWVHAQKVFTLFGTKLDLGWLSIIPVFFVLSAVFAGLFLLWERKEDKEPLINMELFRDRNYAVGNIVVMFMAFAMMGSFFLLPLFLQSVLGFSPAETGRILLPLALPLIFVGPLAGKYSDKIGARYLAFVGLLVMAAGQLLIARFTVDTKVSDLILPFVIMGIGMGMIQAPVSSAVLRNVPPDKAGGASGVITTIRQIGSVMGIAVLGALLQSFLVTNITTELKKTSVPESVRTQIIAEAKEGNAVRSAGDTQTKLNEAAQKAIESATPKNLSQLPPARQKSIMAQMQGVRNYLMQKYQEIGREIGNAVKHAFTNSINSALRIGAMFTLFAAFVALFLDSGRKKKKQDTL